MKMRVVNGVVVNLSANPEQDFTPELAAEFIDVPGTAPEGLQVGYYYNSTTQEFSPPPAPPVYVPPDLGPQFNLKPSPMEFFLLFNPLERVILRALRKGGHPIIEDWMTILDDERLSFVDMTRADTIAGIMYLTTVPVPSDILTQFQQMQMGWTSETVLSPSRAEIILQGMRL